MRSKVIVFISMVNLIICFTLLSLVNEYLHVVYNAEENIIILDEYMFQKDFIFDISFIIMYIAFILLGLNISYLVYVKMN